MQEENPEIDSGNLSPRWKRRGKVKEEVVLVIPLKSGE
jgi:hypothetical protein